MEETMHKVDFTVPLSGSQLFDYHSYAVAKHLCTMFPPLDFEIGEKAIRIYGMLNDFWYEQWNRAVFSLGEFER